MWQSPWLPLTLMALGTYGTSLTWPVTGELLWSLEPPAQQGGAFGVTGIPRPAIGELLGSLEPPACNGAGGCWGCWNPQPAMGELRKVSVPR